MKMEDERQKHIKAIRDRLEMIKGGQMDKWDTEQEQVEVQHKNLKQPSCLFSEREHTRRQ